MNGWQGLRLLAIVLAIWRWSPRRPRAINIEIDYTYDTSNFFGSGNPQGAAAGAQAKAALEAAASYFSHDSHRHVFGDYNPTAVSTALSVDTACDLELDMQISTIPSTDADTVIVTTRAVAANQYIIYAGARSLPGITAGIGGPGGYRMGEHVHRIERLHCGGTSIRSTQLQQQFRERGGHARRTERLFAMGRNDHVR